MRKSGDKAHGVSFNTFGTQMTSHPLKMAEPTHRIPPGGVTSAASLRSVPKSCIHSVKDICMFYVNKVSGEYSNHPAAARYVHQMAEEIILQLAGVASEIKKNRGEPELYAALLEEWEEHFPANLGAMGTPKAISLLLQQQTRDIARLKSELENEKLHRDSDVSGILRSMDAQLHAYRSSVLHDRRQLTLMHEAELTAIREKSELQQRLHQEALLQLQDNHAKEMQNKRKLFEKQAKFIVTSKNQEITKLTKIFKKRVAMFREKLQLLQDKLLTQKLANSELRAKYHALARSFNETVNLSDSSSSEASSVASSEDENNNNNATNTRRQKRKSRKNRDENLFNDPEMEEIAQLLLTGNNEDEFFSSDSDHQDDGDDNSSLSSHSDFEGGSNDDDNNSTHLDNPEKHQEQDMLEALTQIAEEKKQRRLRKQQRKLEKQVEFERFKSQLAAQNAEKRVSKKQQRDQERRDVAQFSRSVLSGDFSSVGGKVTNMSGNNKTNNKGSGHTNINNSNSAVSKALREKLLTVSATNRKLEQRAVRNEALLKRINENYETIEKQMKLLTDERATLLRRLQEEESRNEALRRALSSQLAINLTEKSNENKNNSNISNSDSNLSNNVNNLSQLVGKIKEDYDANAKLQGAQNIDSFHDVLLLHNTTDDTASDTANRVAIGKILNAEKVVAALRDVKNTAQLLVSCHTPHFLEKERDISAPLHNPNNIVEDVAVKSQHSKMSKNNHNAFIKEAIAQQIGTKKEKKSSKSVRLSPYLTAGHF